MERDKQEMEVMERERQGQCAKGFMRLKQKTKSANEKKGMNFWVSQKN